MNLKSFRIDNDLKQSDIAKVLHITQHQYSLYELEYREMPISLLIIFCKYYNISSDYILALVSQPRFLK